MNWNLSKANSSPTSGKPTKSLASTRKPARYSGGSISKACSAPCTISNPAKFSTASPTTPSTNASSSPANSGPTFSKSAPSPNHPNSLCRLFFLRLDARILRNRSSRHIFVNHAALHHEDYAPHGGNVLQRIAIQRDDVCLHPRRNRSNFFTEPHRLRSQRVGRNHGRHRLHAAVAHPVNELLGIPSVRTRHRVGAKHHFQPRRLHRSPDQVVIHWQNLFHRREALFGIAGRSHIPFFVLKIVLDHQAALRIEIRSALRHQFQIVVRRQRPVFNLRAAGQRRRAHRILIGVDDRAQSQLLRLVAGRVQLLLR